MRSIAMPLSSLSCFCFLSNYYLNPYNKGNYLFNVICTVHVLKNSLYAYNCSLSSFQVVLSRWPPEVRFPLMALTNLGCRGNDINSYATALTFQATHHVSATTTMSWESILYLMVFLDSANITLFVVSERERERERMLVTVLSVCRHHIWLNQTSL